MAKHLITDAVAIAEIDRLTAINADLLAALEQCIKAHCPHNTFFCSTCSPARKLLDEIKEGQ